MDENLGLAVLCSAYQVCRLLFMHDSSGHSVNFAKFIMLTFSKSSSPILTKLYAGMVIGVGVG